MFIALNPISGEYLKGKSLQEMFNMMLKLDVDWEEYEFYELGETFPVEAILIRKQTNTRKEK